MQAHTYVFSNETAAVDVIVALPRAYSAGVLPKHVQRVDLFW